MHFSSLAARYCGNTVLLFAALAAVGGCSKKDPSATQVIAKVDGEEISVHQMNGILAKVAITQESLPNAKREILDQLIEQQIAINEATSKKLDRTPEVVMAIENARREILARSVLDQVASLQPKPTDEEAKKYFSEHPELFAQRRLFNLQEISLGKMTQNLAEISGKVSTAKTMEELTGWLKDQRIDFTANGGTRAAEQIPLEILPRLQQFKDGQMALIEGRDAVFIMRVVASRSAPVEEAQSLPKIKLFLYNQRGADAIKREKLALREKAKVEYFGEFSGKEAMHNANTEAQAKAEATAQAAALATTKANAEALSRISANEQAAAQAESEARTKARIEGRVKSAGEPKPINSSANVNLEQGIKGLK